MNVRWHSCRTSANGAQIGCFYDRSRTRGTNFLMRFCCFLIVFAIFNIVTPDLIGGPWSNGQSMDPRLRGDDKQE